jgi:hypothetical protein
MLIYGRKRINSKTNSTTQAAASSAKTPSKSEKKPRKPNARKKRPQQKKRDETAELQARPGAKGALASIPKRWCVNSTSRELREGEEMQILA